LSLHFRSRAHETISSLESQLKDAFKIINDCTRSISAKTKEIASLEVRLARLTVQNIELQDLLNFAASDLDTVEDQLLHKELQDELQEDQQLRDKHLKDTNTVCWTWDTLLQQKEDLLIHLTSFNMEILIEFAAWLEAVGVPRAFDNIRRKTNNNTGPHRHPWREVLLLTLIRLRQGFSLRVLAFLFAMATGTVAEAFNDMCKVVFEFYIIKKKKRCP
jgi:hypothetical protein